MFEHYIEVEGTEEPRWERIKGWIRLFFQWAVAFTIAGAFFVTLKYFLP
jgi:hypothetical protein